MDDQKQCCDNCSAPEWVFEKNDGSIIIGCGECPVSEGLRYVSKKAWNVATKSYDNSYLKLEVAP